MRTRWLQIAAVVSFLPFLAQAQPVDVAALAREADSMSDSDTLKIIKLTDCARALVYNDPPEAQRYAQRALDLAIKAHFHRSIGATSVILGTIASQQGDFEGARRHYDAAVKAYRDGKLMKGLAMAQVHYSKVFYLRQEYEAARRLVEEAREIYGSIQDAQGVNTCNRNLAALHYQQGRHELALPLFQASLAYSEQIRDTLGQTACLNNIGLILSEQGQPERAASYFERSLAFTDKRRDKEGYAVILNSVAASRKGSGRLEEALAAYMEVLEITRELKSMSLQTLVLRNIGNCHNELGNLQQAERYYKAAIALADSVNLMQHQAGNLSALAAMLRGQHRFEDAIEVTQRSLALATMSGTLRDVVEAQRILLVCYRELGDYVNAYKYTNDLYLTSEKLYNEEIRIKIAEASAKFDAERREQQIVLLEKDKAFSALALQKQTEELLHRKVEAERDRQRIQLLSRNQEIQSMELDRRNAAFEIAKAHGDRQAKQVALLAKEKELAASIIGKQEAVRNSLIGGMVLIGALGFVGVRRVQGRRREAALRAEAAEYKAQAVQAAALERERAAQQQFARRLIESQENERKRLAGELHDELGQELLIIKHRAQLALAMPASDGAHLREIVDTADEAIANVRKVSRDLRPYQLERAGLSATLRSMLESVARSTELALGADVDDIDGLIHREREIDLYRVVQEAVNNILKHAAAATASVRVRRAGDGVEIRIADDGRGFDTRTLDGAGSTEHGLGLQGMSERVQMLGGRMEVQSAPGHGATVLVTVPASRAEVAAA